MIMRIIDMRAADVGAGSCHSVAFRINDFDDLVLLERVLNADAPILACAVFAVTLDVAACLDIIIFKLGAVDHKRSPAYREPFDDAGGVDRAVGFSYIEIAAGLSL